MIILSTQGRKYETKTFNENFAKKVRNCRLLFPETWSLNSLICSIRVQYIVHFTVPIACLTVYNYCIPNDNNLIDSILQHLIVSGITNGKNMSENKIWIYLYRCGCRTSVNTFQEGSQFVHQCNKCTLLHLFRVTRVPL
jgi:hypothetical protein